jgi:hypothetical protein
MIADDRRLIPAALASIRPVQWVVSPNGGPIAKSITFCTMAASSPGRLPAPEPRV